MEQVSGRAGRRQGQGKVLIQTSNPKHPILWYVQHHDYAGMYNEEIEKRRQFNYPPYSRIIHISFRHKERHIVTHAAEVFAANMQTAYGKFMVGPAEPVVNRVRNLYLMEMLLKLPKDAATISKCKSDILKWCAALHSDKKFAKVIILPDVDAI
jgi:primosomal protein N' (replication factor Y)